MIRGSIQANFISQSIAELIDCLGRLIGVRFEQHVRRIQPPHLASWLRREDLPQAAFARHAVEAPLQAHHRASNLRQPAPLIHEKHFRSPGLHDLMRQFLANRGDAL